MWIPREKVQALGTWRMAEISILNGLKRVLVTSELTSPQISIILE
ncbi:hypothetical protein TRKP33_p0099 (plasmid) [Klebsiella pneumoniae]|uniref:Uncharacterized protein n=3 Tax=Klebsiella TaxID=570 RepID=A0A6M6A3I2_KLEPN|nr:Hypothetical protein [Klebsiella aerogenes]QGF03310.1 hypothetical protein pVir-SCNJ1-65 [Klebsiella pneumoniae subsp. pneumoniae]QJX11957.1 hypothetical protein [Klebsiella pneumoniae]QJX13305.1 hypothetical protein [Klebsiella pneumoniae]QVQ58703.1 hypothetical protein [Klebsiella pneumoniae]